MGVSIDLHRFDYKKTKDALLNITKEKDETIIDKILAEFGTKIDNDYIVLANEYYEDGHCLWNLYNLIEKHYKIDDVYDCFIHSENKPMVDYKTLDEAYENIGFSLEELEDYEK